MAHELRIGAFLTVLCTPLAAQQFTTPAGYETRAAGAAAYNTAIAVAGNRSAARQQSIEPDMLRDATLRGLAWRTPVTSDYAPSTQGIGRSFHRLTLVLGYATDSLSIEFSQNWRGTPTTVFQGAWSVPSITGKSPVSSWGNAGSFVFSSAMIYQRAKGQLLQEWSHSGGQLANGDGLGWPYPFLLDAPLLGTEIVATRAMLPRDWFTTSTPGPCNLAGYIDYHAELKARVYGDGHATTSLRGRGVITAQSTIPTGNPVVAILSFRGTSSGVEVGARCNKLYVDPASPWFIGARAKHTGSVEWFPSTTIPWDDRWAGIDVYFQSAWEDPITKAFSLSNATRLTLPHKPRQAPTTSIHCFAWTPLHSGGPLTRGTLSTSPALDPVELWNRK